MWTEWKARRACAPSMGNSMLRLNKGSNMKYYSPLFILLALPCMGMGRLPPSTPATLGDVYTVQDQVQGQQTQINSQQDQLNNQQASIDKMQETKLSVEGVVRLYDGKRITLEMFDNYDVNHSRNFMAGTRITLKLGKSYTEKLIDKQQKQIEALEALLKHIK